MKKHARNSSLRRKSLPVYELLEARKVLAAIFPTYIDGQFTLGNGPAAATPYDLADTFKLESNPKATKTIYLDFDGHHSVNNRWGHDIVFPAFNIEGTPDSFTDAELIQIQRQFQNVAEDFLPFDVNVTTREPALDWLINSGNGDQYYGVRDVNTQATDGFGNGIGGVAYLNSFDDGDDSPVFSFNKGSNNGALTSSHEVGHALGLLHDGLGGSTYHPGTGTGETSWGPLLGAPFGENVTQFSNGDYAGSTNTEDDFAVITKPANGFGFRADLVGDSFGAASDLAVESDGSIFSWNIIEQDVDIDMYAFETGGAVSLNIDAMADRPNLDILAKIYDADGNVVAQSNPVDEVGASFSETLAPGQYYLSIEGIGKPGVYSDYGSVGFYSMEGTIEAMPENNVVIGEAGRLTLDHNWTTVEFDNSYVDPVVIAGPSSRAGTKLRELLKVDLSGKFKVLQKDSGHQLNVRIRNLTSNGFEIHLDEWEYLDGRHTKETVDYLVVEAGEHTLTGGSVIVAGNQSGQTHVAKTYNLGSSFDSTGRPVVFSQIVTENDGASATTRMRFTSDSTFQVEVREEEAAIKKHGAETISYIAIQQGVGTWGESNFDAGVTPDSVTHNNFDIAFRTTFDSAPAFFADMQTHDGRDTTTVRYRTLAGDGAQIFLEEEQSRDSELNHTREVVGYLAIELGDIVAQDKVDVSQSPGFLNSFVNTSKYSFRQTPAEDSIWQAVLLEQSWTETTYATSHIEDDHDHDLHKSGILHDVNFVGFELEQKTVMRDDSYADIVTEPSFDAESEDLELAGAMESDDFNNVVLEYDEAKEDVESAEFNAIDEVFAADFDMLV